MNAKTVLLGLMGVLLGQTSRADEAAVQALTASQVRFACGLYAQQPRGENLFYSPYSVASALAMTSAGARGETAVQLRRALALTLDGDALHATARELDAVLASRATGSRGTPAFKLTVANALWGQQTYTFLEPFLGTLSTHYGAGLRKVDFAGATEASRQTINGWVGEQTHGKITDLLPPGVLTALTRLVLTNAIYFNAPWAEPFARAATAEAPFTRLDGRVVRVPLMHHSQSARYGESDDWQAVEWPYAGGQLSLLALLPRAGKFAAVDAGLSADTFTAAVAALKPARVNLALPRFGVSTTLSLKPALLALGMTDAFEPDRADFSGMNGTRDLYIAAALHKAFVKVDESGTEAAAATAVVVGVRSARPGRPVNVTLDRPFVFGVRDRATGALLFLGRVVDPS